MEKIDLTNSLVLIPAIKKDIQLHINDLDRQRIIIIQKLNAYMEFVETIEAFEDKVIKAKEAKSSKK